MMEDQKISLKEYLSALPVVDRTAARSFSVPSPIDSWMWGLASWGQPVLIRACYALAHEAFRTWIRYQFTQPELKVIYTCGPLAYAELRGWIETGDESYLHEIRNHQSEIEDFAQVIYMNLEEGVNFEEPYYAALVCYFTLRVASWTSADIETSEYEADEMQARLKAGPAFEATQAIYYAKRAFGWSEEEMRARIADALIVLN